MQHINTWNSWHFDLKKQFIVSNNEKQVENYMDNSRIKILNWRISNFKLNWPMCYLNSILIL